MLTQSHCSLSPPTGLDRPRFSVLSRYLVLNICSVASASSDGGQQRRAPLCRSPPFHPPHTTSIPHSSCFTPLNWRLQWGEHIHLGYYTDAERAAGAFRKDFKQAKLDFCDEMLKFAGIKALKELTFAGVKVAGCRSPSRPQLAKEV
eukprot:349642-Chlamydomonas_euryale.AAC.2